MRLVLLLLLVGALAACGAAPAGPAAPASPADALVVPSAAPAAIQEPAPTATPRPAPSSTTAPAPSATAAPPPSPTAGQPTATAEELAAAIGPVAPTAAPTAAAPAPATDLSSPSRLVIQAIGLDRPLISVGLDPNRIPIVPNHDVGWYNLSAVPGAGENVVFWGHVLRFRATPNIPAPFDRVDELAVGDRITVYNEVGAAFDYAVTRQVWVTPDQVQYILPQGREQLTLVSCIGDKVIIDGGVEMTHRLITIAEPVTG